MKLAKIAALNVIAGLVSANSFALSCPDFQNGVKLKPTLISVGGNSKPTPMEDDGAYTLVQSNCSTGVYTVSSYSPTPNKGPIIMDSQYTFSVGKLSADYRDLTYPAASNSLYNVIRGVMSSDSFEVTHTMVQVNLDQGDTFPKDAFAQQENLKIEKDSSTGLLKATDVDYLDRGIYGTIYYKQIGN